MVYLCFWNFVRKCNCFQGFVGLFEKVGNLKEIKNNKGLLVFCHY